MKSTVETLSPTRVRLAVEVPFEELKPSLDAAYKKIGAQVKVPGFRPGKVPARVIDQRVGRAAVLEEAINDALPRVYSAAAATPRSGRSASPRSTSRTSTTVSPSASRPRSTCGPRSTCPTWTAWKSRSPTSRSATTKSTSNSAACATGSARSRAWSAPCRPATTSPRPAGHGRRRRGRGRLGQGSVLRGRHRRPDRRPRRRARRQVGRRQRHLHQHPAAGRQGRLRGRDHRDGHLRQGEGTAARSTTTSLSWPASSTRSTSSRTTCARA